MKYVLTAGELLDRGVWIRFCELRGINEWAMNEGLMSSDEEFTFTEEEAVKLGIGTPKGD
jgi:hypothetical protein